MEITIEQASPENIRHLNQCENAFRVDSRLVLSAEDGQISYTVVPIVPAYIKRYDPDHDYTKYLDDPNKAIFFAFLDSQLAGQVVLATFWNGFGIIDDISVEARFRNRGVGRALMEQAIAWAKGQNLAGLIAETQDINVNACCFYERTGFILSGFDRNLYRATLPGSAEIALFWYLLF